MTRAEFIAALPDVPESVRARRRFLDLPLGLSIAAANVRANGKFFGLPFLWCLSCGDLTLTGRTLPEFAEFIVNDLQPWLKKRRAVIFVFDTGIAFQFLRMHFVMSDVFACAERKPLTANLTKYVILRDGYALSGMALQQTARTFGVNDCPGEQYVTPAYTPGSELPADVVQMYAAESRAMSALSAAMIKRDGGIANVPLTKTARVRREIRNFMLYNTDVQNLQKRGRLRRSYSDYIHGLTMSVNVFNILNDLSCGGLCGLNRGKRSMTIHNAVCWDKRSAYPAAMMYDYVPQSSGTYLRKMSNERFTELCAEKCVCARILFYKIHPKDGANGLYISRNRCGATLAQYADNALVSAETCTLCCTELDFACIDECYIFDNYRIEEAVYFERGYLPDGIRRKILEKYHRKERETGEARRVAKEELLSIYGMMVQNPCKEQYPYESECFSWGEPDTPDIPDAIEKYNNDRNRFLYFPWGIWIAAHVRRTEWQAWQACGASWIYGDTDSAICEQDAGRTAQIFAQYNAEIRASAVRAAAQMCIPFDDFAPGGKLLGEWRSENVYRKFLVNTKKRYLYEDDAGEITAVIAGVDPNLAGRYCAEKYGRRTFDAFSETLYFPATYYTHDGRILSATGRKFRIYIDDPIDELVRDADGFTELVRVESSILQIYTPYRAAAEEMPDNEKTT